MNINDLTLGQAKELAELKAKGDRLAEALLQILYNVNVIFDYSTNDKPIYDEEIRVATVTMAIKALKEWKGE